MPHHESPGVAQLELERGCIIPSPQEDTLPPAPPSSEDNTVPVVQPEYAPSHGAGGGLWAVATHISPLMGPGILCVLSAYLARLWRLRLWIGPQKRLSANPFAAKSVLKQ